MSSKLISNLSGKWPTIVISVLIAGAATLVVLTYLYQQTNSNANLNNTLYPFSAVVQPNNNTVFLKNAAGNPQIDCSSVGGKINIVGAWSEVIDPYSSCSSASADVLNLSCGIKSAKIPCKQDADCGSGMSCTGGMCTPSSCPLDNPGKNDGKFTSSNCSCGGTYCTIQPGTTCKTQADCNDPTNSIMYCTATNGGTGTCQVNAGQNCMAPDSYSGQFCASYPLCSNSDRSKGSKTTSVVNTVCNPNGNAGCRPRDSSAYLAGKCDGKNTCPLLFDPTDPNSGFGPAPCDTRNMGQLPITPGQNGNYSQGYYVHGLYTCIVPQ